MAFSGNNTTLKVHTHDGTVIQDGGSLDFKNVTQGAMTAGSITQSDGVHSQELLIGTPNQVPRVNAGATALEYHTPSDVGEELVNKGSLHGCTGGSSQTEVVVGIDTHVLTADSTTASGLAWAAAGGGASCSDSLTISGQTNTLCKWLELGA